ncbi:hypothetical protein CR970_00985 [Candidatus Saccharibacteria bacterium]|nr:MAG: hypothetical protein CR970_00985 [Candidatus Saccharibacteria bacterium]
MTLAFDVQILQTAAFDRGMGRYTASLLQALGAAHRGASDIEFILNKNLDVSRERMRYIRGLIPGAKLTTLDLPVDLGENHIAQREEARNILSRHFSAYRSKVDFVMMAPFFVGFASAFPDLPTVRKHAIVYDFIPYRIWHKQRIFPDDMYFGHFGELLRADMLFCISQAVRNDLVHIFGFEPERTATIDGGSFEVKAPKKKVPAGVKRPYLIYPSAPIIHKNNHNAIRGFELFNAKHAGKYQLVITSSFNQQQQQELAALSDGVVFTGNVTNDELYNLYEHADGLLFASYAEGLGMPILEAIGHGIPVACSNIPVLREMVGTAAYVFSPTKPRSIADALQTMVEDDHFADKKRQYAAILQKYTWERSAKALMSGVKALRPVARKPIGRLRVYVYDSVNRSSAVESRLLQLLYAGLSRRFDVEPVYADGFARLLRGKSQPSYVPHVPATEEDAADRHFVLRMATAPAIGRSRKVALKLSEEGGRGSGNQATVRLRVRRVDIDAPLGLRDWQLVDGNPNDVVGALMRQIGEG